MRKEPKSARAWNTSRLPVASVALIQNSFTPSANRSVGLLESKLIVKRPLNNISNNVYRISTYNLKPYLWYPSVKESKIS